MEKSFNPFEMWGSYIGIIIGLFIFSYKEISNPNYNPILTSSGILWFSFTSVQFWVFLIMGFLIGWGIHSLFRRFTK